MSHSRPLTRYAFDVWLRTGRVPASRIEYKFNGWHDPNDGKFTEVGAGRYFPEGSSSSRSGEQIAMARPPRIQSKRAWQGGGFTGGGGGNFGGAGATGGGWETPQERRAHERQPRSLSVAVVSPSSKTTTQTTYTIRNGDTISSIAKREKMTIEQLAAVNSLSDPNKIKTGQKIVIPVKVEGKTAWVSVKVGQLTFELDEPGRTRVVAGNLGEGDKGRSKRLQAQAGGADRLVADDGGHFIAPRFGGPKETYNHFAQDANFNRGAYRALEDVWAKAQKNGENVSVRIDADYLDRNQQPDSITVRWSAPRTRGKRKFKNQAGGHGE